MRERHGPRADVPTHSSVAPDTSPATPVTGSSRTSWTGWPREARSVGETKGGRRHGQPPRALKGIRPRSNGLCAPRRAELGRACPDSHPSWRPRPWGSISGAIGLGHAGRDIAIAKALRALNPSVKISWLAGDPARQLIADAGETLLPSSVADETASAEQIGGHFTLNVAQYAWRARSAWAQNVARFKQLTDEYPFDVVVGDETYELVGTFAKDPALKRSPFVVISDFVGLDMPATTRWSGSWSMP